MERKGPAMPEPTKKEVASDQDQADLAASGGWLFVKGKDLAENLRRFARWDSCTRVLGLLLLGACAYYLRELTLAVLDLAYAMKGNPK